MVYNPFTMVYNPFTMVYNPFTMVITIHLQWFTIHLQWRLQSIYNGLQSIYNGLQSIYNGLQSIYNGDYNPFTMVYNPFTMAITIHLQWFTIHLQWRLQSIYNGLQSIYNGDYNPFTIPKTIVVKFRRGLESRIQDAIATMTSGRPSDEVPTQWYSAACTLDQNRATNEAFRSSYRPPNPILSQPRQTFPGIIRPPIHAHVNPSPGNPVPMDVDAARKKASLPLTCYRCGKPGHKSTECALRFDIRALSVDELQSFLESKLA